MIDYEDTLFMTKSIKKFHYRKKTYEVQIMIISIKLQECTEQGNLTNKCFIKKKNIIIRTLKRVSNLKKKIVKSNTLIK